MQAARPTRANGSGCGTCPTTPPGASNAAACTHHGCGRDLVQVGRHLWRLMRGNRRGPGLCCSKRLLLCVEQTQAMLAPAIGGQMNQSIIWQGKHLLTTKYPAVLQVNCPPLRCLGCRALGVRSFDAWRASAVRPGCWQHLHTLRTRGPMQPLHACPAQRACMASGPCVQQYKQQLQQNGRCAEQRNILSLD